MANKFVEGGDYRIRHMAECQARHILKNNLYSRTMRSGRYSWSEWFERMFGKEAKTELLDHGYIK